jgi:hypothetical protein
MMNSLMRERLRKFALEELEKTKGDTEELSFLFRTEGSVSYVYSPWAEYEDKEFDGGVDQLDLPWTLERRDELTFGLIGENPQARPALNARVLPELREQPRAGEACGGVGVEGGAI